MTNTDYRYILPAVSFLRDKSCRYLARFFSTVCDGLSIYSDYINNMDTSTVLLNQLLNIDNSSNLAFIPWRNVSSEKSERFSAFCEEAKKREGHSQMNLASFLVLPIQRVPRYRLLLDSVLKSADESLKGVETVQKAIKDVDDILTKFNGQKKEWDRINESLKPLSRLSIRSDSLANPLFCVSKGRELKKVFDRAVILKHTSLENENGLDALMICGKESQFGRDISHPVTICRYKKDSKQRRMQYESGWETYFDVSDCRGKKCMVYVCSDLLVFSSINLRFAGCLSLPIQVSHYPLTGDVPRREMLVRLCDGKTVIYLAMLRSDANEFVSMISHF